MQRPSTGPLAAPQPTASELGSSHTTKTCGQLAAETSAASSFAPPPIAESVSVDEEQARKELSVLQQELRTATRAQIESKAPVVTPVPIAFDTDDVGPTPPIPVRNAQQFVPIGDKPQAMQNEDDLLQKHMDSYSKKSVSSAVTAAELKLIDLRGELEDLRAAKVEKENYEALLLAHSIEMQSRETRNAANISGLQKTQAANLALRDQITAEARRQTEEALEKYLAEAALRTAESTRATEAEKRCTSLTAAAAAHNMDSTKLKVIKKLLGSTKTMLTGRSIAKASAMILLLGSAYARITAPEKVKKAIDQLLFFVTMLALKGMLQLTRLSLKATRAVVHAMTVYLNLKLVEMNLQTEAAFSEEPAVMMMHGCESITSFRQSAILFDGGCTHLMTNSTVGLLGMLVKVDPKSFTTAAGTKSFDTKGLMVKSVFGMNGVSVKLKAWFYFERSLPFDIYGFHVMRQLLGALYIDSDHPTRPSVPAKLRLKFAGDIELTLGRTENGLEWLFNELPPAPMPRQIWALTEASALSLVETSIKSTTAVCMPTLSSGAGMGKLQASLSPLEAAILDHVIRGHPSLKRQVASRPTTEGGLIITEAGIRELAILGCDVCNAYRITLFDPKEKKTVVENGASAIRLLLTDSFGKVETPSAQYKYQYAHLALIKEPKLAWLIGSKDLSSETVLDVHKKMVTDAEAWFPGEAVKIIRMDSFSTYKGKELGKWFLAEMLKPTFSPPGQHAYIGDGEVLWYPIFIGALISLRQKSVNTNQWFNAMSDSCDKLMASANNLDSKRPTCAYERALKRPHNVSDLTAFFAPGRFALDKAGLGSKWKEKARAGFAVGRDIDFVMNGTIGSQKWWDGSIHRTVVNNWFVQQGGFLDLTAPGNRLLPTYPSTGEVANLVPARIVSGQKISMPVPNAENATAPSATPIATFRAAILRKAAGKALAGDEVCLSGAHSRGVLLDDGTVVTVADAQLLSVLPQAKAPIVTYLCKGQSARMRTHIAPRWRFVLRATRLRTWATACACRQSGTVHVSRLALFP